MPFLSKKKLSIFCCLALVFTLYEVWLHTIHTVIPNQVYRAAQLSPALLGHYIKTHHIKAVINLRGARPSATWYQQEVAVTEQMGAHHYDLNLASKRLPSTENMRALVYILLHAPKPLLVHCLGGADRSGLASAIALILDKNTTLAQSETQISVLHLVLSPISIGKLVFPYYQSWLSTNHLPHNRANFLQWVCAKQPFNAQSTDINNNAPSSYNPCSPITLTTGDI